MTLKFKEPHVIRATYRIVTPMFIGDAEQKASGISPASVKGALRFWWRALNWGRIRANHPSDRVALQRLHKEEGALFGTSAENGKVAKFTIQLDTANLKITHESDWPAVPNSPSSYIGMGLWQSGSHEKGNFQPHREYIRENQCFTITLTLTFTPDFAELSKQLHDVLLIWGLLGGLGSRARRAFGAVAIESINEQSFKFADVTEYQKIIESIFDQYRLLNIHLPPFSALSQDTKFSISTGLKASARLSHASLGEAFRHYRGQPSALRGSIKRVFGLPYAGGTKLENDSRRSSPLFFHVHPIGNQFVGGVLFLPSEFHHHPDLLRVDYKIAADFLKKLEGAVLV